MFLQVCICIISLLLTIPCLAIVYRLIKNKFFGTVFNLHMAVMFILTALKTSISPAINLTLATGSEDYRHLSCILKPMIGWIWQGSMAISVFYALLFKYVMVSNAHNDPGEDELKMFNYGYLAGISGILLAWNGAHLIKTLISDNYVPFTANCLKTQIPSNAFSMIPIAIASCFLCVLFSVIFTIRTKSSLAKLEDRHLRNLPSKNALTYLDTLILLWILALSFFLKSITTLFWKNGIWSFENALLVHSIVSIVVDDIGVCFFFSIYIILKTRRYLPKLWDSSRPIVPENNDFYSVNPATVGIQPQPQPRNDQVAESSL